jgi:hypothetical protein
MTIWQVLYSIIKSNLTWARPLVFINLIGKEKVNEEVKISRTRVLTIGIGMFIRFAC